MPILKLKPAYKDYIWGGSRLKTEYNKKFDGDILAESWELSCHPDGLSLIDNGEFAGISLAEYIHRKGKAVLGTNCASFHELPILTKLIDAKGNLSIQVHPNDEYALKYENQLGKSEMWYIVDCGKDAYIYYGFKEEISQEDFKERIKNNTILSVLNKVPVSKGDIFFIEAGTIHAICSDIIIAEIQENSNVTYRVYDYDRIGKDGKKRELHIKKALEVTNRTPMKKKLYCGPHLATCKYFTVDQLFLDGKYKQKLCGTVSEKSFLHLLVLDGNGHVHKEGEETIAFRKGDSIFLTAGLGTYEIEGCCDILMTTIPE